jgi:hypothetical protein
MTRWSRSRTRVEIWYTQSSGVSATCATVVSRMTPFSRCLPSCSRIARLKVLIAFVSFGASDGGSPWTMSACFSLRVLTDSSGTLNQVRYPSGLAFVSGNATRQ